MMLVMGCSESSFQGNASKVEDDRNSSDDLKNGGFTVGQDNDNDGIPDYLDDNNGDGIPDGYVDTDGDGIPDALPEGLAEVVGGGGSAVIDGLVSVTDCDIAKARGYLKTDTKVISYEGNRDKENECSWEGEDGGRVHGYKSWKKDIGFSDGIVVCEMELNTATDKLYYDDGFLITLNDKALIWGTIDATKLDKVDGFRVYDWDKLKKSELSSKNSDCADGKVKCEVPPTQKEGKLDFSLNREMNLKLMKDIEAKGAKLTLRGFGDNDEKIDCTHSGIDLNVVYKYFEK